MTLVLPKLMFLAFLATLGSQQAANGQGQQNQTNEDVKLPVRSKTKFAATTDFAFDFYKQLSATTGNSKNIVFSPLSIYVAFAMLKAGARKNTEHEMEKVLKWQQLIEKYGSEDGHAAVKSLLSEVFAPLEKNNTLNVANKLWMQKYFCARSCDGFINTLKTNYDADLGELNFAREAEKCRKEINKWVEDQTNNKIQDLLPEGSISALTRFVITNAIYFKGKWKYQFDKGHTRSKFFKLFEGERGIKTKEVLTMTQNAKVFTGVHRPALSPYNLQLIDLPYEGQQLSMIIMMPRSSAPGSYFSTLADFRRMERDLTASKLNEILRDLYKYPKRKTDIFLPKFKLTSKVDLKGELESIGMRDVFNAARADLSGITGYRGMCVSSAQHKAFINVDEEGTEAAAATSLSVNFSASESSIFNADSPFIFMIVHNPSKTVLFLGRVMDPSAKN